MSRVGRKGENVTAHTFSLVLDLGAYTELHRLARASHTGPPDCERTERIPSLWISERESTLMLMQVDIRLLCHGKPRTHEELKIHQRKKDMEI